MAKKSIGLSRDLIIHPGETLKEILDDRDMSQRELAYRTHVKEAHVSNIIRGKKAISISYAKNLEYALGIDANFWINLQSNYDKELADYKELNEISDGELQIVKKIKEIIDYAKDIQLVDPIAEDSILVIELRKLLNISRLTDISKISQSGAYRLSSADNVDSDILFTWLRIANLIADQQELETEFDLELLEEKLPLIKALTFEDFETIHLELKKHLAECGIKFVLVKHFRGAPVQGVIKKNDDGTLSLIMTLRRKYADVFWFTFFHEIGHIINEDIEGQLIDYEGTESKVEDDANQFAADLLINSEDYKEFVNSGDFSILAIKKLCEKLEIPKYILIGRLQRDEHLSYSQYSYHKTRYEEIV